MGDFDATIEKHLTRWRDRHCSTLSRGAKHGWVLPEEDWEEGLWPALRSDGAHPLKAYVDAHKIKMHTSVHNLKSSWVLCANLYFPFGRSVAGRDLLAAFLQARVDPEITRVDGLELEWAGEGALSPQALLGETGGRRGAGQTSPDVAFVVNGGRGIVLTESKFAETSFYECSAYDSKPVKSRAGNPDNTRCTSAAMLIADHVKLCHQATWGRKYWQQLASVANRAAMEGLASCPALSAGYQLFRQQALAEALATSGAFDLVVSSVASDERNSTLQHSLRSTGIATIDSWGKLFDGRARFATFTHQDWVDWVASSAQAHDWNDWLSFVRARYDFAPRQARMDATPAVPD